MRKIERIGLDRLVLSVHILKINIEKLKENIKKLQVVTNNESMFYGLQYFKIIDNERFSTLCAGIRRYKKGASCKVYCKIEFSLSFINEERNNLQNITIDEYLKHINSIFLYIKDRYGIELDMKNIKVQQMEINCNILLNEPFKEYDKLIEMMMYNLSNQKYQPFIAEYKYVNKQDKSLDTQTFCRGNKAIEFIIYDKKQQLKKLKKDLYSDNVEIMRIEIRLKTAQKVKEVFHTNNIWNIKMSQIRDFFLNQMDKYFFQRFDYWKKENVNTMRKMVVENRKKKKNWILATFEECRKIEEEKNVPLIIDIKDYIDIVNSVDNHYHSRRNAGKILEYNQRFGHVSTTNNKKMQELKEKIRAM